MLSIRRFASLSLALCSLLPLAVAAQEGASLPKSVLLRVRGKVGDTVKWEMQNLFQTRIKVSGSAIPEELQEQEEREQAASQATVQSKAATGNFGIVYEVGESVKRKTAKGKTTTTNEPGKRLLITVSALGDALKRQRLPMPKSTRRKGAKPNAPSAVQTDEEFLNGISFFKFPEKPVEPGDTWRGVQEIPDQKTKKKTMLRYEARLLAIEAFRGVPCAKVEYTFEDASQAFGLTKESLAREIKLTESRFEAQLHLVAVVRYSLDRGLPLDTVAELNGLIAFEGKIDAPGVKEGENSLKVEMTLTGTIQEKSVKFPAYEKALAQRR